MKALVLFSLMSFSGCGDSDFRKVEQLDGFRILAVEANNPELPPGGSAALRLFVSDPNGPTGGRAITGTAVSCIDPGISLGAPAKCDHDPNRVTENYTIDTTLADLQNNLGTGFTGLLNVTVPNTILMGRSAREKNNGVAYITIFSFTVDGQKIETVKRVIATDRVELNSNPAGSAILLNGAAIAGPPQKGDQFTLTTSAPETYTFITVDGTSETRAEEFSVAWYVSGAEFNRPKASLGEATELTKSPPAGAYLIIGVARDDRGGVEVVREKIP